MCRNRNYIVHDNVSGTDNFKLIILLNNWCMPEQWNIRGPGCRAASIVAVGLNVHSHQHACCLLRHTVIDSMYQHL